MGNYRLFPRIQSEEEDGDENENGVQERSQ